MVHQPSGGSNHDLRFLLQLTDLTANAGTAVENCHADALIVAEQTPQFVTDLDGQFTGGRKDQALYRIGLRINMLDHRNAESKGLTRSGGRFRNDILPLHKLRNGLCLNGGGPAVSFLFQSLQHRIAQAQILKCNCISFHKIRPFIYKS